MVSRADKIRNLFKSIPSNSPNKYNDKILKEEKDIASKYSTLFHSIVDIELQLKNLCNAKEQIAKERFEVLSNEE